MRTWKDVATLVKTKSLDGRFQARPAANLPFLLSEGMCVAFVPPKTDCPRTGTVVAVREVDGSTFEVAFDSVQDGDTAHELVGCHCLVRRSLLDIGDEDSPDGTWVGLRVFEASGEEVGEVVSVIENPGQLLLEVERLDGKPPAYIPLVDEIVLGVDASAGKVLVDLPDGLLDL